VTGPGIGAGAWNRWRHIIFVIMRACDGHVLTRLSLLVISVATGLYADSLPDAVRVLAARIAPHLGANETAHINARNRSSLPGSVVDTARAELVKALRKRVRNPVAAEIMLTLSENVKGFLLVAQMRDIVEMAAFQQDAPAAGPALVPVTRRLLWEQNEPILDVSEQPNRILVLSIDKITAWERDDKRGSTWTLSETAELAGLPVRDPRGRLVVADNVVQAFLPGVSCRGLVPPLRLMCDDSASEFPHEGVAVHFTPGRNTISPPVRDDTVTMCLGNLLVTGRDDTLVLMSGETPVSEPVELGGRVTALWPAASSPIGGAIAVARNSKTKQYAAYSLSVDCPR
jgi:hypothetical protein